MITLAQLSDLHEIKKLTEACAVALQEKGVFQWNEHYPSTQRLKRDIELRELYVFKLEEKIMGIVALTSQIDEEYFPVKWLTKNKNNLYVHRLASHPLVWGKGIGRKLMDFAEEFARENGYISVRLDTFSKNTRNQKFYEQRGYKRLENVYFPKQSEFPFFCYEKIIV